MTYGLHSICSTTTKVVSVAHRLMCHFKNFDVVQSKLYLVEPDGLIVHCPGTIDAKELQEVMRRFGQKISERSARELIRSVDIDQNNEIDFTEFLTLMKSRISRDPDYELRMAFDMIDADGNGTVSIAELRSLMRKCNQYLTEEEIDAIMRECDVDGSGELDFAEFQALMKF